MDDYAFNWALECLSKRDSNQSIELGKKLNIHPVYIELAYFVNLLQGIMETQRRIAKRLLSYHSVVTVSELTGLRIDEVQELKDAEEDE